MNVTNNKCIGENYFCSSSPGPDGNPPVEVVRAFMEMNAPGARWLDAPAVGAHHDSQFASADGNYGAWISNDGRWFNARCRFVVGVFDAAALRALSGNSVAASPSSAPSSAPTPAPAETVWPRATAVAPAPSAAGDGQPAIGSGSPPPTPSANDSARERMVYDFKEETRGLLVTAGVKDYREIRTLSDARALPAPTSEAIARAAEHAREFRRRVGYADSLRECATETAMIDALVAYDHALKALQSGDGPSARASADSLLREHPQTPSSDQKPLWNAIGSIASLCGSASAEASEHSKTAASLARSGKTSEATKEYEKAYAIFPDPKITETIKKLKEDSLGL